MVNQVLTYEKKSLLDTKNFTEMYPLIYLIEILEIFKKPLSMFGVNQKDTEFH